MPGSFVDEALKWRHSDVLFTASLDGRDAFGYALVEHQSSDDPLMAFRALRYVTRIWDQYEREHPKSRELIESCMDLDTLNGWFRRASKADKASDLFEK